MALGGCAAGVAMQPDRLIFSLDGSYQRYNYSLPIEDTFDKTVKVFRQAGYRLDVTDRATGQISGRRGTTGDRGTSSDKDMKFYALVVPRGAMQSELNLKIVQLMGSGVPLVGGSKTEVTITDAQMYQFAFHRIETFSDAVDAEGPGVAAPSAPQGL
jgi:hypothetical protein